MKHKFKHLIINLLLFIFSTIITIIGVEFFFRITKQYELFNAATEISWMRNNTKDLSKYFTIDPDFGFRPILGNELFDKYGTIPNNYPHIKRSGINRLLFIGDSVTMRGRIIEAIKHIYGENHFEYWNAGVESFNTIQEVKYYQKFNVNIHPDHVILTFHINDFEPTPVAFFNKENKLVVYVPHTPLKKLNRWLFEYSFLYRWVIGRTLNAQQGRQKIAEEIENHLKLFHKELISNNIRFSVLVLPLFKPYNKWSSTEKEARNIIISILRSLNITYFDLFIPFSEALARGVPVQEHPGDTWHPSREIAEVFAKYLFEHSFQL